MNISIQGDMVSVEFRDANPEKFNEAVENLKMGVTETAKEIPNRKTVLRTNISAGGSNTREAATL
jgi:hypothetical protein